MSTMSDKTLKKPGCDTHHTEASLAESTSRIRGLKVSVGMMLSASWMLIGLTFGDIFSTKLNEIGAGRPRPDAFEFPSSYKGVEDSWD